MVGSRIQRTFKCSLGLEICSISSAHYHICFKNALETYLENKILVKKIQKTPFFLYFETQILSSGWFLRMKKKFHPPLPADIWRRYLKILYMRKGSPKHSSTYSKNNSMISFPDFFINRLEVQKMTFFGHFCCFCTPPPSC